MSNKVILIILDGWGIAQNPKVSAIDQAKTPFMNSILAKYPHSKLTTHGLMVGLPEGQMGNSEVGHMNIGAGRVVYQDLVKINLAIKDNTLKNEPAIIDAVSYAKKSDKKVHLIGLVSDGGVHSHIDHVKGLVDIFTESGIKNTYIHAFTDGRDTDPKSGLGFLTELYAHCEKKGAKIASVIGRYYAMDRDNRWERVKLAYDLMVHGTGEAVSNLPSAIEKSYEEGVTDEFLKPMILDRNGIIEEGDVVICFNFRTDRGREITIALTQKDFPEQHMKPLKLHYVTMTNYDDSFKDVSIVYPKDNLNNTLGEVLATAGKKQIRIAETEKYPHVTFFFSGGREKEFEGEKRIMCASPKVATYDLQPEMSAIDIKNAIVPELKKGEADFIVLNFANADMVGHTGDFNAAIRACEAVDACNKEVVEVAIANGYTALVTADHGNSDYMINDDGTPNTAHTTNLVHLVVVGDYKGKLKDGKLGDLAPTVLKLMNLKAPKEMTGNCLVD
ncbi:MAG: 2,3-bisphosphoglycerate-independent phosphoglycerate mutase [Bacteroidota bacterium]|nr:2,3-bisphosphoglycerate-independent phosphoglycerate mutase [Bacteroidota bacterium]